MLMCNTSVHAFITQSATFMYQNQLSNFFEFKIQNFYFTYNQRKVSQMWMHSVTAPKHIKQQTLTFTFWSLTKCFLGQREKKTRHGETVADVHRENSVTDNMYRPKIPLHWHFSCKAI